MELSKDILVYFARFIESEIGIIYTEDNFYQLERRLIEIAKQVGYSDVDALWRQALTGQLPGTVKMLILDVATNNETLFFRDQSVFRAIDSLFKTAHTTATQPFRIWSAACSTGQEIMSVAMIRSEIAGKQPFYATIVGTDVSTRVLARAQNGIFSQLEIQRGLSAPQIIRYFEPVPATEDQSPQWQAKPELLKDIKFFQLNLLQPSYPLGQFELILCRNVLIYQTIENKRSVVKKLIEHLVPGGVLILGASESLMGVSDELTWENMDGTSIYRNNKMQKIAS